MIDQSPTRPIRILLTEDNPSDVYLIRLALKETLSNFTLEVMDDGEKASRVMEQFNEGGEVPDIILLDLNLPRWDGKEVLKKLREMPGGAGIPVIIITSSDSPRDRDEVARMSVCRYFRKPSDLAEFMKIGIVVKELLQLNSSNGPKER